MIIDIISVPLWQGSGHLGADLGPSKLLDNGLVELIESLGHKVGKLVTCNKPDTYYSEKDLLLKYKSSVISCCNELQDKVKCSLLEKHFPLIIGGDHALVIGSLGGITSVVSKEDISVIWIDAHTDINTSNTSPSHNIHGMPLCVILGLEDNNEFIDFNYGEPMLLPKNLYYLGVRSIDEGERKIIDKLNIKTYGMDNINYLGIDKVVEDLLLRIDTPYIHVSFDVDFMDSSYFDYTGCPVSNGPTLEQTKRLFELLFKNNKKIISMDLVEYNPSNDEENKGLDMIKEIIEDFFDF